MSTNPEFLTRLEALHGQVNLPAPGRGRALRAYCKSCTNQPFPCATLQLIAKERNR